MKDGVLLRQVTNAADDLDLGDYEESHAFGEIYETILKELQSAGSSGEFYTPSCCDRFHGKDDQSADWRTGCRLFLRYWRFSYKLAERTGTKIETTEDQSAYDASIYGIEKEAVPLYAVYHKYVAAWH